MFTSRDGWFRGEEVSSLQPSPIREIVMEVWPRRNSPLAEGYYHQIWRASRGVNTKDCRKAHGCGLWRGINDGWEKFSTHLALVVGDGSRILFWHDRWVGDTSLKMLYLQLYACSNDKEACISDLLGH